MAKVAERAGIESTMGQSPFAIARGRFFERALFKDDAKRLREALDTAGALPPGGTGFIDLRISLQGGPCRDLDDSRTRTLELLRALASGKVNPRPVIVASPTLLIPSGVMLPEALLVVDLIAIGYSDGDISITVGEIKTYPDRGGYTDPGELATARGQAGVYVHALRMVINDLGLASMLRVNDEGFLVLSRPGSNRPSIRAHEDLQYQAWRADRGFAQLERAAAALPGSASGGRAARIEAVLDAATAYRDTCISFCDLAVGCIKKATERGDPAILGHDVERLLGRTNLHRAEELLNGAAPATDAERELVRVLQAYD